MNNQQAINLLKVLAQSLDDYCGLNDEGKAAFRMAITALELFGNAEQLPSAQPEHLVNESDNLVKGLVNDCISRQDVIRWIKIECNPYGSPTLDFESGKKVIAYLERMPTIEAQPEQIARDIATIIENEQDMRVLNAPSAQPEIPEIIRCKDCKYAEVADKEDRQDGYTCQFHRGSIWFSGSYCSWAERRQDADSSGNMSGTQKELKCTETHSCDYQRTETHDSCTDCPLYDHDRHNCPRFNKVIPTAILDAQPRWISVAEQLPEEDIEVLTYDSSFGITFDSLHREKWRKHPVAWMPLPEPYKGETE